jgi:DNA-binding transcriptional LysR family regulator
MWFSGSRVMDLRRLRYFVAVAEELHFRRAADRLYVTQPVVSEQVGKLESELELKLLSRDQQQVELTDAGAALLVEARRLLRQSDELERVARGWRQASALRLRLGFDPGLVSPALLRALRRLRGTLADVEVSARTDVGSLMAEDVRRDLLDAAVVTLPAVVRGLRVDEVGSSAAIAILPGDQARADAAVGLDELAESPILTLSSEGSGGFNSLLVGAFAELGLAAELVESGATSIEGIALQVEAAGLPAVIPGACPDWLGALDAQAVPIEDAPRTTVALISRDERPSPQLRIVIDLLTAELAEARPAPRLAAIA